LQIKNLVKIFNDYYIEYPTLKINLEEEVYDFILKE
jgi:hypothetical protein